MNNAYDIGMIGLGTMGRNLALNIADHGFPVAGYNRHLDKVALLEQEAEGRKVLGVKSEEELTKALRKPRAIMMMVPAGNAVDQVIRGLLPYVEAGDILIDGGNSHYKDTDIRGEALSGKGIHFLGIGISGGEKGARFGPSVMPGGQIEAYERVRPIFEAAAAKVDGNPCVTYLGPGSAGHYVKMVHNGIEYGLMQLISETYHFMKSALRMDDEELADVYHEWNEGDLKSFLVEITADIFRRIDDKTGEPLIDMIRDSAKQKGTGKWTSQDGMDLQVPMPTIDMAVAMRNLSMRKDEREALARRLPHTAPDHMDEKNTSLGMLHNALYFSMITTFAQGMALLKAASNEYKYQLPLDEVARIWTGGCIIRAKVLEPIRAALRSNPDLPNLMLDANLSRALMEREEDLRGLIQEAVLSGIPVPGLMASLAYLDAFRSSWLPANLIQAQRDLFGSHTYERNDEKGTFHTAWEKE
jgi:6-phosphogluconate dehydrogenase